MDTYQIQPEFNSDLTSTLFKMESIRNRFLSGDTPTWLFYDLKSTLHLLESLNSARIEGNHTTLIEAIDNATKSRSTHQDTTDAIQEILNIQDAINYTEANITEGAAITPLFLRELHALVVKDLTRDGSTHPGSFRTTNVAIAGSRCIVSPPPSIAVDIDELVAYINAPHESKEDIIRIACAHHRFVQIHPFDNGNGRTARLLTYAMLIKYGFLKAKKTLLNPSSIFCMDRAKYYHMLAAADTGNPADIEAWCNYVAKGILDEIDKMFRLLDRNFAVENLIIPAVKLAYQDEHLSDREFRILMVAIENDTFQAADVTPLFGVTKSDRVKCSRFLSRMVDKGLLLRPPKHPKKYVARFFNKTLLPYVMEAMDQNGLIDAK